MIERSPPGRQTCPPCPFRRAHNHHPHTHTHTHVDGESQYCGWVCNVRIKLASRQTEGQDRRKGNAAASQPSIHPSTRQGSQRTHSQVPLSHRPHIYRVVGRYVWMYVCVCGCGVDVGVGVSQLLVESSPSSPKAIMPLLGIINEGRLYGSDRMESGHETNKQTEGGRKPCLSIFVCSDGKNIWRTFNQPHTGLSVCLDV